ncbi:MAG: hypothetical protein HC836_30295 [Richelia sp. RM2_1_2]|nr:hypothetical protein [Richelia sp. RM2_1_2]
MAVYKIVDLDAWADGQIRSKLWLVQELEQIVNDIFFKPVNIWNLAGWYGQTAFLFFIRSHINIEKWRSFDVDPSCEVISESINNVWLIEEWKFKAITADINEINYATPWNYYSPDPDIIINTSCEHMTSTSWFNNIPNEKLVVLQSTNMDHSDHYLKAQSIDEFKEQFPLARYFYADEIEIKYKTWSFKRFMIIGEK